MLDCIYPGFINKDSVLQSLLPIPHRSDALIIKIVSTNVGYWNMKGFAVKLCNYPPLTKWGAEDIVLPSVCVYVRSITSPIFKI